LYEGSVNGAHRHFRNGMVSGTGGLGTVQQWS
jgi:hypothetical protein